MTNETRELNIDELDNVSGATTIQSGFQRQSHTTYQATALDLYVVNPPPPTFVLPIGG